MAALGRRRTVSSRCDQPYFFSGVSNGISLLWEEGIMGGGRAQPIVSNGMKRSE
jgi:hypothetical protein